MAGKKVFMLRVNPEIYEALEKWAADEFRSVNGQLEWMMEGFDNCTGYIPGRTKYPKEQWLQAASLQDPIPASQEAGRVRCGYA